MPSRRWRQTVCATSSSIISGSPPRCAIPATMKTPKRRSADASDPLWVDSVIRDVASMSVRPKDGVIGLPACGWLEDLGCSFEGEVQQYEPSVRVDVLLARLVPLVRFPGGEGPDEFQQCVALSGPGRMILRQQQPGCGGC